MRNIHASTLAELAKREFRVFLLLDKEISSAHHRYTDCQVPILFDGNLYMPRRFKIGQIRFSTKYLIENAKLSMDNVDAAMTLLYAGRAVRGSRTTVYLATVDEYAKIIGEPIVLFPGKIDDWKLDEVALEETLKSRLSRGDRCTLRRHMPSCPWEVFKGAECGYSGEEIWCDRSYARCSALGNSDNFGGERWISSLINKQIWWGRSHS